MQNDPTFLLAGTDVSKASMISSCNAAFGAFRKDKASSLVTNTKTYDDLLPLDGEASLVNANRFAGLAAARAGAKSRALVATIRPAGVAIAGPDDGHPLPIGDLKIVGSDISDPVFAHQDKEAASFPKKL